MWQHPEQLDWNLQKAKSRGWQSVAFAASVGIIASFAFVSVAFAKPALPDKTRPDRIRLSTADLFPSTAFLVKLEVVEVDLHIPRKTEFRVLHVYAGPPRLKDIRFETPVYGERGLLAGRDPFGRQEVLRRGDIGLFVLVEKHADDEIRVLTSKDACELNVRTVIHEHKNFKRFLELADVVQQIYQADDEDRLRIINDFLRCPDVVKAYSAFWYLKQAKNPALRPYMVELTRDNTLPIEVQMDLNDLLREREIGWAGSRGELELVAGWFTRPWKGTAQPREDRWYNAPPKLSHLCQTEEEALNVWLEDAAAAKRYSAARVLDFAGKGLANPKRTAEFKGRALRELKVIVSQEWDRKELDDGFLHLVLQTKHGPNTAEKVAAAKLLGIFAPFDAGQLKELRALLAANPNEEVAAQLRAILDEKR